MTASSIFPSSRQLTALSVVALLALLGACGSAPQKSEPVSSPSTPSLQPTADLNLELPASLYDPEFSSAETALANNDWMSASVALLPLQEEELSPDDTARKAYLQARISHLQGEQSSAMAQLRAIEQPGLHPAIAYRVHNFERALLGLQGDSLASAQLGVRIMGNSPQADQPALKRSVWQDLQRLSDKALTPALAAAAEPNWKGWLQLASISRGDLTHLSIELPRWITANPGHPAADPLPGGLEYLEGTSISPDKVALLLPLSGRLAPAGKAVRDGYLASYFQARKSNMAPYEVLVMDSDNYSSALEAYNDAVLQGARLVVGPLKKSSVSELAGQPGRNVPVLALNQIDHPVTPAGSALVQLSLAPEDEAVRIAELAFGEGARRALILSPAGSWGEKMERVLAARWQQLGGEVANSVSYTGRDDYSSSIKSGLGLAESEARKQRLRDMLATNVEFTPRRRQDLDVVFMLSRNSQEARSVKPLLAFHYAGQLPVYAPSSVYSGSPDERDRDLDGLRLVDLPWLLGSNPALKSTLASVGSDHYTRLNALGVDAYLIQSRFLQLQAGADASIRGDTGLLTMNPRLQMVREPAPATFDRGVLTRR